MTCCSGRRLDGSTCTSERYVCSGCREAGCAGFGCEWQRFVDSSCDFCGCPVTPVDRERANPNRIRLRAGRTPVPAAAAPLAAPTRARGLALVPPPS